MSRKYRQSGYQDSQGKDKKRRRNPSRSFRDGPRSPRMTKFQQTFRCALCGTALPGSLTEIELSSQCPNCSADLHTCKNCAFFDPGSRFECTQPIEERISKKDERNSCPEFEPRTTVEKATSSQRDAPTASSSVDPREAFERLFKK